MTDQERCRAFALRLRGESWERIGGELGYTGSAVFRDMEDVLRAAPRRVRTVYPVLGRVIDRDYGGCVSSFARCCGIPPRQMYDLLPGRRPMTGELRRRILRTAGLREEDLREERP